ncbi:CCHC-type domain-containing protein [Pseudoscourfieldia marina]
MSLKVPRHDNPSSAFKRLEMIFADFFPDAGENMKLAVLLMVIDESKYRGILDSLELRQDNPSYSQLKDQIIKHYMRRQSSYEANKDRAPPRPQVHQAGTNPKQQEKEKGDRGQPRQKRKTHCKFCKAWVMHKEDSCWNNPKNKHLKPADRVKKQKKQKTWGKFCSNCGEKAPNHKPNCKYAKNQVDGKPPPLPAFAVFVFVFVFVGVGVVAVVAVALPILACPNTPIPTATHCAKDGATRQPLSLSAAQRGSR